MSDLWTWGATSKKTKIAKPAGILPPTPKTGWCMPDTFPDLSGAKMIAFDCETYDPHLLDKGPGFVRGESYVVGVAIGTDDGYRAYFPVRHTLGNNMNPDAVFKWLNKELGRSNQIKINHNILYDLEALFYEGVTVKGDLYDTQYAEALIDENKMSYSLDNLGKTYFKEGKVDTALYDWSRQAYGGTEGRKQAANIYRCPTALVGPYAEGDVDLPLRIFVEQKKILGREGLWDLFLLECRQLPLLLNMRKMGVRVDIEKAEEVKATLKKDIKASAHEIFKLSGIHVDVWAAESVAKVYKKLNIPYNLTATGRPSFTNAFFDNTTDDIGVLIQKLRKSEKFLGTFIQGYILDNHHNGRVHGQFHPLRGDDGGTVSGRYSASKPNLQNLVARDAVFGPLIRGMFLPEIDHEWCCADYKQIEPRILLHYADGPVAARMKQEYADNAAVDFYAMVMELCKVSRPISKGLTLGMMYAMGKVKLAFSLGLELNDATPLFERYHKNLPFINELSELTTNTARHRGYIKTLLGRRSRFPLYEKAGYDANSRPLPYDAAKKEYGSHIVRAMCYKALNRLIQGGAADVFKTGLVNCHEDGLFDKMPVHTLVHDEINFSVPKGCRKDAKKIITRMENSTQLTVPMAVDYKIAANWGEAK